MNNHINDQYYLVFPEVSYDEKISFVAPTKSTRARSPFQKTMLLSEGPAVYRAKLDEDTGKPPANILHDTLDLVLHASLLSGIAETCIYQGKFFPAIFEDDHKEACENYWLVNLFNKLDCWDRKASDYVENHSGDTPHIHRYSLDEKRLASIKEEERLIFRIGGTDIPNIFIHQTIADALNNQGAEGIRLIKVSDYELGMEF
ncbi:Uncharacterised protein [BD1-7 clade bacterium]|uniref:Immunity MXAN-0049 protein domain-containing protein n=1 Tax=BD1-7 clade bacterium TaxID=2029982 RepID=A0A5S9QYI0_9GAMM|nr:Uncharacterised protein [BD1-7 clade bacterium]